MMKKKLFLCRSFYHILVSILITLDSECNATIVCIENEMNREELKRLKKEIHILFSNIEIKIISSDRRSYSECLDSHFDNIYFFHWVIYKKPEYDFYKAYRNRGIYLIEDGTTHFGVFQNDFKTKKIYLKFLINFFLIGRKDFVLSKYVKAAYVTFPEKYPLYLKGKIERLALNTELNQSNKEKILKLFDVKFLDSEIVNNKLAIVFTQPLSEDGFISEEKKLFIYSKIIKELKEENYTILFKQHPREVTEYCLTEEIIYLNKFFPAEILNYLDLNIQKAIAVCSGVIYNINAKEKIQLIPNFFSKYSKKLKRRKRNE